jgi:hypothetical protein
MYLIKRSRILSKFLPGIWIELNCLLLKICRLIDRTENYIFWFYTRQKLWFFLFKWILVFECSKNISKSIDTELRLSYELFTEGAKQSTEIRERNKRRLRQSCRHMRSFDMLARHEMLLCWSNGRKIKWVWHVAQIGDQTKIHKRFLWKTCRIILKSESYTNVAE